MKIISALMSVLTLILLSGFSAMILSLALIHP